MTCRGLIGKNLEFVGLIALCVFFWGIVEAGCKTARTQDAALQTVEIDDEKSLASGTLTDKDMKELLYRAIGQSLGAKKEQGEGTESKIEPGDMDGFKFTILRLTKDGVELSGDGGGRPDGMEVEITGWYKKVTRLEGRARPVENCGSFDLRVAAVKVGTGWQIADKIPLSFAREDEEDCY
jgi:hypothetical protein